MIGCFLKKKKKIMKIKRIKKGDNGRKRVCVWVENDIDYLTGELGVRIAYYVGI